MTVIAKTKVSFPVGNQKLIGELYSPEGATGVPAVVVVGPMTSVKEQVTGKYAEAMAHKGIVALAFDHRHYGESDGIPRQYEHYPTKIEDVVAAIDFLSSQANVLKEKVGLVGVCLGCGYASWASLATNKLSWLGLVVGYYRDVEQMKLDDPSGFNNKVQQGIDARIHFEKTSEVLAIPAASETEEAAMTAPHLVDYYTRRANVENYQNVFATMSREHFLPFDVQSAASKISVPVTFVHALNAISPASAIKFFGNIASQKSEFWLSCETQDEFYDTASIVEEVADILETEFLSV